MAGCLNLKTQHYHVFGCGQNQNSLNLFLFPFQRHEHVQVLASGNPEDGSWETMRTGEREKVR